MKSRLPSFPFFTLLGNVPPSELAFMFTLTDPWLGSATFFLWLVPVFNEYEMAKPDLKPVSCLMCRNYQCQGLVVQHWQKAKLEKLRLRVIRLEESHLLVHLLVQLIPGRRGAMRDGICDVLQPSTSSTSSSLNMQSGTFPKYLFNGEALLPTSLIRSKVLSSP